MPPSPPASAPPGVSPPPVQSPRGTVAPAGVATGRRRLGRTLLLIGVGAAGCGAALLYFFPPEHYALYPRCLLYELTGWQCPGCGGLRAIHQLLHGRLAAAFALNPLLVLLLPVIALAGIGRLIRQWTGRDWLRPLRHPFWIWTLVGAVVAFGIGRNLAGY